MLKYRDPLSLAFQALADPTRRDLVDRLLRGPASVSQLAEPLDMTLPAVVQHLAVLEGAGLVRSQKIGRVRTFQAEPAGLRLAEDWLRPRRTPAESRLDRLGQLLTDEAEAPTASPPAEPTPPSTDPTTEEHP